MSAHEDVVRALDEGRCCCPGLASEVRVGQCRADIMFIGKLPQILADLDRMQDEEPPEQAQQLSLF